MLTLFSIETRTQFSELAENARKSEKQSKTLQFSEWKRAQRQARRPGNKTKATFLMSKWITFKPEASVFSKIKHGFHVQVHKFAQNITNKWPSPQILKSRAGMAKEACEKDMIFGPQLWKKHQNCLILWEWTNLKTKNKKAKNYQTGNV